MEVILHHRHDQVGMVLYLHSGYWPVMTAILIFI